MTTKERLQRAAAELIVEVGWGQVSTRAVAARAGVPTGTVHYHFASVGALQRAAVKPLLTALASELTDRLEADGIRGLLQAQDADAVLLGEVFMQASRDPELRADVADVLASLRADLTAWLTRQGLGDRARPVATVLVAAVDALGMHRAVDPGLDVTGVEQTLLRLVQA